MPCCPWWLTPYHYCLLLAVCVIRSQTQRRLESDRFYTKDYTEEVYTPEGIEYVENTTMGDILT